MCEKIADRRLKDSVAQPSPLVVCAVCNACLGSSGAIVLLGCNSCTDGFLRCAGRQDLALSPQLCFDSWQPEPRIRRGPTL